MRRITKPQAATLVGLLLGLTGGAHQAMAQGATDASKVEDAHVYVGLVTGTANGSDPAYRNGSDLSTGLQIGYQFNSTLAVELFGRSLSLFPGLQDIFTNNRNYYPDDHKGLALRARWPLSGGFHAYGRVGVGQTSLIGSKIDMPKLTRTEGTVGGGLGYDFGQHWGVRLEYIRFLKSDVNNITAGVEYRF